MIRYIKVANYINSLQLPGATRQRIINCAIAQAISNTLSFPTSEVSSPNEYFFKTHYDAMRALVSDINEEIPLLMSEIFEQVSKLFLFRYNVAFPKRYPETDLSLDYFCSLSEVDRYFSQEEFEFLRDNRQHIFHIARVMLQVFEAASKGEA